jgi:hypothetical protein
MSTMFRQVQYAVPQKKTPKKPSMCVKDPFFPTILAHRNRWISFAEEPDEGNCLQLELLICVGIAYNNISFTAL